MNQALTLHSYTKALNLRSQKELRLSLADSVIMCGECWQAAWFSHCTDSAPFSGNYLTFPSYRSWTGLSHVVLNGKITSRGKFNHSVTNAFSNCLTTKASSESRNDLRYRSLNLDCLLTHVMFHKCTYIQHKLYIIHIHIFLHVQHTLYILNNRKAYRNSVEIIQNLGTPCALCTSQMLVRPMNFK